MFQRIPTVAEVNATYMNLQDAAEALGLPASETNLPHKLGQKGIQVVRLCGRPMVYRHEVKAKAATMEADTNVQ